MVKWNANAMPARQVLIFIHNFGLSLVAISTCRVFNRVRFGKPGSVYRRNNKVALLLINTTGFSQEGLPRKPGRLSCSFLN